MYKPEPDTKPDRYAVIYVGHADDLSRGAVPVPAPARRVLGPAGRVQVEGLHLHATRCRAATAAHREQIARELTAVYRPGCNAQQYDQAWKDEWIRGITSAAPTSQPRPPAVVPESNGPPAS